MYGKLAVLNLGDSGRQIGEKLFALLSPGQKKDLVQFFFSDMNIIAVQ